MNLKNFIYIVNQENYQNLRLDRWLSSVHLSISRSFINDLIDKKNVTVNGKFLKPSYLVQINDRIEITYSDIAQNTLIPLEKELDIFYEDEHLVVVNKPAGLVVHPAAGHFQDTLVNILLFHIKNLSMKNENRPGIIHRIDKDTSGLLVIAKNDFTHEYISHQFKEKTSHRVYYAVVEGTVMQKNGVIQSFLKRSISDRKKYVSCKLNNKIIRDQKNSETEGKWAVTEFECLEHSQKKSLLKLKLQTGRTHQIRVHLSELGHPLVGDTTYGYLPLKYKQLDLKRFYLHAAELGIVHPVSKDFIKWISPWPSEDLEMIRNWGFNV